MNCYRLPHPALFTRRAEGRDVPALLQRYAAALTKLATSKGSQAVLRAAREQRRAAA